jgi:hypothetical protein
LSKYNEYVRKIDSWNFISLAMDMKMLKKIRSSVVRIRTEDFSSVARYA